MAWVVTATPLTIPRYGAACGVFAVWNRTLSVLLILLLRYTLSVLLMVTVHFISVPCMLGLMYLVPHILCVPCLLYDSCALILCPYAVDAACAAYVLHAVHVPFLACRVFCTCRVFCLCPVSCMCRVCCVYPICYLCAASCTCLSCDMYPICCLFRVRFCTTYYECLPKAACSPMFIETNFVWKVISSRMVISASFSFTESAIT